VSRRRLVAAVAAVSIMLAVATGCDTTDDTTYAYAGDTGIVATPDLQFFKDAGAPLIHLQLLCNFGGTLRYVHGNEVNVNDMNQGQTLNVYCRNYSLNGYQGVRSTDWAVVGRPS
jgi:hypothetical protein